MTYRELIVELQKLDELQLDCDITVYDREEDEFYIAELDFVWGEHTDVLEKNHPFFSFPVEE